MIRLLRYRPRSICEARERLASRGFERDAVEETIHKAEEAGLLDDRLFARLWVEDRLLYHPLSRRAIAQELADKKIAPGLINEMIEAYYPPEKEKRIALELAQKRIARYQNLDPKRRERRTIAFLNRRGFDLSLARSVVRDVIE